MLRFAWLKLFWYTYASLTECPFPSVSRLKLTFVCAINIHLTSIQSVSAHAHYSHVMPLRNCLLNRDRTLRTGPCTCGHAVKHLCFCFQKSFFTSAWMKIYYYWTSFWFSFIWFPVCGVGGFFIKFIHFVQMFRVLFSYMYHRIAKKRTKINGH